MGRRRPAGPGSDPPEWPTSCQQDGPAPRSDGCRAENKRTPARRPVTPCRPHRDRTVRGGVEVVNGPVSGHRGRKPCATRRGRSITYCDGAGSPDLTEQHCCRCTALLSVRRGHRRPATSTPSGRHGHRPARPSSRARPVTGRARMIAVGDKSPYSLIPSSSRRVRRPDLDDILALRPGWRLILDSAIGLAVGVEALRSIAFVSSYLCHHACITLRGGRFTGPPDRHVRLLWPALVVHCGPAEEYTPPVGVITDRRVVVLKLGVGRRPRW